MLRLTARDRDHLAAIGTLMRPPAGVELYHGGEPAKSVFSVSSGTLASYRGRADGARRVVGFLFAEDVFGLASRGVYVNTVKTVTPAVLFRFPTESLLALLTRDAALQLRFLCKVTHALRETQRQAIMLTRRDPVERVAMFLAHLEDAQGERKIDRSGIGLPMTHQDIGDYLNLPAGTVDGALEALTDRGLIRQDRDGAVHILERDAFTALVGG
jgi:CRP/FNR family transcriptional regulator